MTPTPEMTERQRICTERVQDIARKWNVSATPVWVILYSLEKQLTFTIETIHRGTICFEFLLDVANAFGTSKVELSGIRIAGYDDHFFFDILVTDFKLDQPQAT